MWEEVFSDYKCENCGNYNHAEEMYRCRVNKSLVTFNPGEIGETSEYRGKEHWFCSEKCRSNYLVFNNG